MKKISKKRIFLAIILVILIIFEIIAFKNSRAEETFEIIASVIDNDNIMEKQEYKLNAINEGDSGNYVSLPAEINGFKVNKYYIEEKEIINVSDNENESNIGEQDIVEKAPGDKVYLTNEEKENKNIELKVEYDRKEVNGEIYYNRIIDTNKDNYNIKVEGYMPKETEIEVSVPDEQFVQTGIEKFVSDSIVLDKAYDIKLKYNEQEFNSYSNNEDILKLTFQKLDEEILEENKYIIVDIAEDNIYEENIEIIENKMNFETENLSTYAILKNNMEKQETTNNIMLTSVETYANSLDNANTWDGTIAEGFEFGEGTQEKPYLIINGGELAYLAEQVNNGNTYENIYFQVANDIDLAGKEWTPIGDRDSSFRGIFDGAGHIISNAFITIDILPTNTVESYGFFGTIGGGDTETIIKNIEFDSININFNSSGRTGNNTTAKGWHIGTVTGTMYKNAKIINVIANNGEISGGGDVTIRTYSTQLAVGGIAGYAMNTYNNNSDPGTNGRYEIANCYSNIEINIEAENYTTRNSTNYAQYHAGGIIGTIRSQAVWPENCLYSGNIASNGFIGPIFGGLIDNTSYTSYRNFATLWNGNDAGNLTMNSYFTAYRANNRSFTTSVTSGNSTQRISSSSNNVGYVQGVNKGRYTNSASSRLNSFNSYSGVGTEYMTWKYENNTFTFEPRFSAEVDETNEPTYIVNVENSYSNGPYTYEWYLNGNKVDELTDKNQVTQEKSWAEDYKYTVLIGDGTYYVVLEFIVEKYSLYIDFNINNTNKMVTASLAGDALPYINLDDYTYQWYIVDIAGLSAEPIEGETSLILRNLEEGQQYRLVATNNAISTLSVEGDFVFGNRNVVYVKYSGGNDNNDGYTPQTPVRTLSTAYEKLDDNVNRNANIIVIMGTYSNTNYYNYDDESRYAYTYGKNATLTGIYGGVDYEGTLYFYSGTGSYRYLNGDTTFQYLDLYGGRNQMYFYLQGYSLTMGESITMRDYATSNRNQGLLGSRAPAVHIICGWCQYNYTTLPRNNAEVIIKSGTYGRIIGGGSPGTSDGQGQENSHDFTGSSREDTFNISITIDIKTSTTSSDYDYDVNLLTGGSACGNNYSNVTENIKNGSVGRVLGGSIGDSQNIPTTGGSWWGGGTPWEYPNNTFLGETNINITGGKISELYGGCLGRNMGAVDTDGSVDNGYTGNTCDSYFYGDININITGGEILNNIYGAGAGGVTGYSENSSDKYKNYGESFDTSVNINISGGTISGNIYGGGYGYTEYLNANVTADDGGSLYGDSNITISGSPTINGNIYGAGCGYNLRNKPNIAKMEGNSAIEISGTPTINGQIFGAGAGVSNYEEMAKLIGTASIAISSDLQTEVYGGGNIAKTEGDIHINIKEGEHTENIFGGGNLGIVTGNTYIDINGGTSNTIFGGGNQASVTNSTINIYNGIVNQIYGGGNQASVDTTNIYVKGGQVVTIYGGSNQEGTIQTSNIEGTSGSVNTIYGGNNQGGNTQNSNVTINGVSIVEAVYGGGNQVDTEKAIVNLISANGTVPKVFGGGNQSAVTEPYVYCNGADITDVFGGSNTNGTITTSNVEVNSGNVQNVFGGNNEGGTTITSNVSINGGNIANVYGGGEKASSSTSNIQTTGGTITNIYGGGNQAGVITTNITTNGGVIQNIFGGSNMSGNVTDSHVTTNDGQQSSATFSIGDVYGGNNQGGITQTTDLIVNGGGVTNVYGGGNQAVSELTNVQVNGKVQANVYGGGNQASVETNTNVTLLNAEIGSNVFGGGNEGTVEGETNVHIKNSTINENVYSGGNGTTATVYGNTNLTIDGTNTNILKSVFGGGNQAETGNKDANDSISTVNIIGGTIGGNVYGGANTSVVYGETKTNIGYDTVNDSSYEIGDIHIAGTVFGGGEANASGSEIYDFSFISVTKGINIEINGNGHQEFEILGSIFGSGNASSTSGESYINIQNYGTPDKPQNNISIQRTNVCTISNSAITLSGTTDRTNEYSDVDYSFSRVDQVKLKNNSTLYLECTANLLTRFDSLVDINGEEVKAQVTINPDTGETTKNVDNRIYMYEGRNLNIATNEQVTAYGEVNGMTFFGLYTNRMNPSTSTGFYHHSYQNGDEITNAGTFSLNSYVMAQHKANHDITIDGFYTNHDNEGFVKTEYIETTPEDDVYYIWMVGEQMDVTTFNIALTASKYATLGTYELSLMGFSDPNIKFSLTGFSAGLSSEISLVDRDEIPAIAEDEETANNVYGLSMKSGNNGWQTPGETEFLTENGGSYTGSNQYNADNSTFTPTLNFCLYHSENITEEKKLGDVRIRLQAMIPVDDLNYKISWIDIIIDMSTALYQDDYFEAAITPGEQFDLFTTTETDITNKSTFSTYYSLYIDNFSNSDYYDEYETDKRVLTSRDSNSISYVLPEKTKITMLDMVTNQYYYYIVSTEDVRNGKFEYYFSDFIAMGSTNQYFDETNMLDKYYNETQDILYENYIFHIDFEESNITQDILRNTLLIELRNAEEETLIGVLGIQRNTMFYSVYANRDGVIDVNATIAEPTIYLGNDIDVEVTTEFKQTIVDSKTIYDTQYFEKKMGIVVTIFDNNGNQVNGDTLLGTTFIIDGQNYYPRVDGTTRINIADKVSNVLSKIKIDTSNNTTIATGVYRMKIESFGSSDGIYYGTETSSYTEVEFTIINSSYGLKITTKDQNKLVDSETGNTTEGTNEITANIEYTSGLKNPNIRVVLYRRKYDTIYNKEYEEVDLADYTNQNLVTTSNKNEYFVVTNPQRNNQYKIQFKDNLVTGTYKLTFKLYDGATYIGEDYEYIIIK